MTETESLRHIAQSRTPLSAWFGIVLLFAIFGVIVLALIGPSPRSDHYEQNRAKNRLEKVKAVRDEEAKSLAGYAWVAKDKGTVRIPIERAMELTATELAQRKPAAAGPIATPTPAAAAPAPAASPAAPAGKASAPAATPKAKAVEGPESQNRNQPAAANNPPAAPPGTQPGANATPAASPAAPSGRPAVSPTGTPAAPPGSPLPVRGKSPSS